MTPSTGYRRKCGRCRVDRHDRCVGMGDCGCEDPTHQSTADTTIGELAGLAGLGLSGGSTVIEVDTDTLPDDTMIGVGMELGTWRQLEQIAGTQERTVEVVMRRALAHYTACSRAGCPHEHDEVGEAADGD